MNTDAGEINPVTALAQDKSLIIQSFSCYMLSSFAKIAYLLCLKQTHPNRESIPVFWLRIMTKTKKRLISFLTVPTCPMLFLHVKTDPNAQPS